MNDFSKKQLQIARLIKERLSEIFIQRGKLMYNNVMLTITEVRLTPDLLVARVYLSVFIPNKVKANKEDIISIIQDNTSMLRGELGNSIRNKVRHVPQLEFYLDTTLDDVFKMEQLFDKLEDERTEHPPNIDIDSDTYKGEDI